MKKVHNSIHSEFYKNRENPVNPTEKSAMCILNAAAAAVLICSLPACAVCSVGGVDWCELSQTQSALSREISQIKAQSTGPQSRYSRIDVLHQGPGLYKARSWLQ